MPQRDLVLDGAEETRPALGDVNHDGKMDLAIGTEHGAVSMFLGAGNGTFARAAAWDPAIAEMRTAPAFGDLDGDGRTDLLVEDGNAKATSSRTRAAAGRRRPRRGRRRIRARARPAPRSRAARSRRRSRRRRQRGDVVAMLDDVDRRGRRAAQGHVRREPVARRDGGALSFAWDFGDGTTSGGGGGGGGTGPVDTSDASAVLKAASGAYGAAKSLRDAKRFDESIAAFQALASTLLPLTSNTAKGTVSKRGTTQIEPRRTLVPPEDRARLRRDLPQQLARPRGVRALLARVPVVDGVEGDGRGRRLPRAPEAQRHEQQHQQGEAQARGQRLRGPVATPMFIRTSSLTMPASATAEHVYTRAGTFVARVTVSDGTDTAEARSPSRSTATAAGFARRPRRQRLGSVGGLRRVDAGRRGRHRDHGHGGERGAVRAAFSQANAGHAIVRFAVTEPIAIHQPLPKLTGAFITIDGNGATLYGTASRARPAWSRSPGTTSS
jgi:hypothetical protein